MARFKTSQKVISMILTVLMLMSTVMVGGTFAVSAADEAKTATIYFVPSKNWKDANARFAAYFFDNNGSEAWASLKEGSNGMYSADYDSKYTNVIFVRMNPESTTNSWDNGVKWNQTADLKIENQCFTLAEGVWDNGNGTWSAIVAPTTPVTTPVTEPVTTPVTTPVTAPVTEPVTNPVVDNAIYFVPSANWKDSSARFAAYFFDGNGKEAWVSLSATADGKYVGSMPTGFTNVIFTRMNPATTDNNWENDVKWNQTADLKVEGNCFTLAEGVWDNGNGTWTTIVEPTQPVTTPVTVPVTEPVTVPVTEPVTNPVNTNAIYFVPTADWKQADARFAAYFFDGSAESTWVSLSATTDGMYMGTIPAGDYKSVIFTRMNPTSKENNWDNSVKWNQTADLKIEGNCFTLAEGVWDNGNGTWTTIVEPTQPVTTPVTVPVTEPVTVPVTEPVTNPVNTNAIYFVPTADWKQADARFAAYFFDGSAESTWVSLSATTDGMYMGTIPTGDYKSVIFTRMNPTSKENNWDNSVKWNQTADLKIEGNCFTLTSGAWDNGTGTWTTIGGPVNPTTPVTEPVTVPVTVPVTEPVTTPVTEPVTNPVNTNAIYFVPSADWKQADARFAAYFFDGSAESTWVSLSATTDGMYMGTIPTGDYKSVIFTRMNPTSKENNWDNSVKWNQTADLKIEGNCFTLTSGAWDNGTGTWTTIGGPVNPTTPVTEPVTVPVTVPVTEPVTTPVTEPVTNPVNTNAIYFVPSANWKDAGARFAAYFFDGSAESTWVSLSATTDGMYMGTIPTGDYKSVIFTRMNPTTTDNNWENDVKWNQTADLKIEGNCFTLAEGVWDNGNGTWTTIGGPVNPTTPVTEPVTVPVTEPVTVPVTEPVTVPVTEPVTTPVTEPVTTPTSPVDPTLKTDGYYVVGDINLKLTACGTGRVRGTIALQPGTYNIKLNDHGTLLGYKKTVNNSSNGLTFKKTFSSYVTLNATGGTYTFQVDVATNALVIKYDSKLPKQYLIGDVNTILSPVEGKTLAIGTTYLEAGTYQFKLSIDAVQFGYKKTVNDSTTGSLTFSNKFSSNVTLIATGGNYTFTLNTATNRLTIKHSPVKDEKLDDVHVSGDINFVLDDNGGSSDIATATTTLEEGTYSFKVYNYGQAVTVGLKITDEGSKKLFGNYSTPLTLVASGGTYKFSFNKTTNEITIEMA